MRRLALAVVAVLVGSGLMACGHADPATPAAGAGPSSTAVGPGSEPAPVAPTPTTSGAAGGGPRAAAPTTTPRPEGPPGTTDPPGPDPAPGPAGRAPTAADDGHGGPPGAFARTLLRPAAARSVVLERRQQAGAAPSPEAVDFAVSSLRDVTGKDVTAPAALALGGGSRSWSADELRDAADAGDATPQGAGGAAVLRVLFVHGTFEGDDSILGIAVRGDVLAVFSDAVAGATTPVLARSTIEEAVLVHELGHLLGLVDLVRDTGRADPGHPGHSTNPKSVMYWAVESDLIGQVLGGPPPRQFDAADRADLRALRDGE